MGPTSPAPNGQIGSASIRAPLCSSATSSKIMIVDDEEYNILVFRRHLREAGYEKFVTVTDSTTTLDVMREENPDILLLDVMMPKMNGLEVLKLVQRDSTWGHMPVIVLTASSDASIKLQALELGATDFLGKPVDPSELVLRIRNTLVVKSYQDYLTDYSSELQRQVRLRTAELEASQREVVHCLARAAESRDEQTGHHILRVSLYVGIIAEALGFNDQQVEMLQLASQLHDVGKIGVSDTILLKPGRLEQDEFELMKQHCDFGRQIIEPGTNEEGHQLREHAAIGEQFIVGCTSPLMKLAASIASTHHEKWNGSGYPRGLVGDDIPIEGRITAVADVFDALTNKRPYKDAFPYNKAISILQESRGIHFDPRVLDAFLSRQADVVAIMNAYIDN